MTTASFSTAVLVADLAQWRDLLGRAAAGLGEDGVDEIVREVGEPAALDRLGEAGDMLERVGDILDGRAVHVALFLTSGDGLAVMRAREF